MAAVNTNDPRKALVFLGAASAKTALDHDMAQGFIEQMAQEHRSLSVTSNKNWGQQLQDNKKMVEDINQLAEENKKLTERLERLEVITKQVVATVVQQNGGSVDEVSDSFVLPTSILFLTSSPGRFHAAKPRDLRNGEEKFVTAVPGLTSEE